MKIKLRKNESSSENKFRANKDEMKKLLSLLDSDQFICKFFQEYIETLEKDMPECSDVLLSEIEVDEFTKLYRNKK